MLPLLLTARAAIIAPRNAAVDPFCYGADPVCFVTDNVLAEYHNLSYAEALTDLVNTYKPEILLLDAVTRGRDLVSSVATTPLAGFTDPDGSVAATPPKFDGSLLWQPSAYA